MSKFLLFFMCVCFLSFSNGAHRPPKDRNSDTVERLLEWEESSK